MTSRPASIPKSRLRGSKAEGIRFEKKFGKRVQEEFGKANVFLDQWVEFLDSHGHGYACIDGYLVCESHVLVWECKLTFTPEMAWHQMEKRYAPLLRHLYQRPVFTLQVCRNLAFGHPVAASDRRTPRRLFESPEPGRFVHHWLGK